MHKKYKFVIVTCHETKHILPSFIHQFRKYVQQEEDVIFLGDFDPIELNVELEPNFHYIQRCSTTNPIQTWTRTLYDQVLNIACDYIILGLDDFLPTKPFNYKIFNEVSEFMFQNDAVVRYDFGPAIVSDYKTNKLLDMGYYDIVEQMEGENYRCSTQFSMWRKDYLLNKLVSPRTPWEFENIGSDEARFDGSIVIGTNRETCWFWLDQSALSKNNPGKINVLGMKLDDIRELIALKYLDKDLLIFGHWGPCISYKDLGGVFNMDIYMKYFPGESANGDFQKIKFKHGYNYT